jgi:hypothetical protein
MITTFISLLLSLNAHALSASSLSWEAGAPSRKPWTNKVLATVEPRKDIFFKAKDITRFCPRFNSLSASGKINAWAELIVGMVKYESSFNPNSIYREPPPLGIDSIGLLQLSYEDKANYPFCNLDRKTKNLQDPINNLDCGIKIMSTLLSRYGYISTPSNKGMAAYWSVVRESRPAFKKIISHVKVNAKGC